MASESVYQNTKKTTNNLKPKSTKELAESSTLTSIPPNYVYFDDVTSAVDISDDHHDYDVPVIDFSLLESHDPGQRSKVVQVLGKACLDWGFFMVVNHGVGESLIKSMVDKCNEFFNLSTEEKNKFESKNVLDPIRYGSSFNTSADHINFWRDYLKLMVHPHFHSPPLPLHFSETAAEYCKQVRRVVGVLLRGISTSLGLDENEIEKSMKLDNNNNNMGLQILAANYYPSCPEPNLAIGMPPHSDHGLLTILTQNHVGGLQVQHQGQWVPINANAPNAFLVNTADQLEILSNGKYKSVKHRAIVNNKVTRISVAIANGPSMDTVVRPATQLTYGGVGAKYKPMLYKDYLLFQQTNRLDGNSCLDIVRL